MAITDVPLAVSGADPAPGNDMIIVLLGLAAVVAAAFAGGCLYQWYRQALERNLAWRDGYDSASQSLFRLAAGVRHTCNRKPDSTSGVAAVMSLPPQPRHARGEAPAQRRGALTDRFERTTVQLLRQPQPACRSDDPAVVVRSA